MGGCKECEALQKVRSTRRLKEKPENRTRKLDSPPQPPIGGCKKCEAQVAKSAKNGPLGASRRLDGKHSWSGGVYGWLVRMVVVVVNWCCWCVHETRGQAAPGLSGSQSLRAYGGRAGAWCARPSGPQSRPSGLEAFSHYAAPVAFPRAGRRRGHQRGARAIPFVLRARAPATAQ
ncbi:hypothetical protein ENBRE01_2172 [Enteropsectra breve]|nr:hypothetical protein ENBRE01_2172 [Enteropsectra breve]